MAHRILFFIFLALTFSCSFEDAPEQTEIKDPEKIAFSGKKNRELDLPDTLFFPSNIFTLKCTGCKELEVPYRFGLFYNREMSILAEWISFKSQYSRIVLNPIGNHYAYIVGDSFWADRQEDGYSEVFWEKHQWADSSLYMTYGGAETEYRVSNEGHSSYIYRFYIRHLIELTDSGLVQYWYEEYSDVEGDEAGQDWKSHALRLHIPDVVKADSAILTYKGREAILYVKEDRRKW